LRHRDWRLLWSGFMASQAGEWMDNLALNWIVLVQTGSPFMLGLVSLTRGIPNIVLSLPAGVIADRFDRRTLILTSQIGIIVATIPLALLATLDQLQIWHIFVVLGIRGVLTALNQPARNSLIGDLVPREDLANAMALNSTTFNGTRTIAPAVAGFLIAAVGAPPVLWLSVVCYGIGLVTIFPMRPPRVEGRPQYGSGWDSFVDGISFVKHQPVLRVLVLLAILPFFLGQPYQSMLPVFAREVFQIGSQGLGVLTSVSAIGAVVGSFTVAGLGNYRRKGIVMMGSMIAFGALVATFAITPWPALAAILLFFAAAVNQVYFTTNNTLLQLVVPREYRGRVLSVMGMDRGFIPLGSAMAGALAERLGAPIAVMLMGTTLALAGIVVLFRIPRMRDVE
jgi:MFS family permease